MITPKDCRKSLDRRDRIWNWTDKRWKKHCDECQEILGIIPEKPTKPNEDDECMVMLNSYGYSGIPEIKYVRDMVPADRARINAYLPSVNQNKKTYMKGVNQ